MVIASRSSVRVFVPLAPTLSPLGASPASSSVLLLEEGAPATLSTSLILLFAQLATRLVGVARLKTSTGVYHASPMQSFSAITLAPVTQDSIWTSSTETATPATYHAEPVQTVSQLVAPSASPTQTS